MTEIAGVESEVELAYAGLHQLCLPIIDQMETLPEPQQAALRVVFGMSDESAPDRFLVGLATLSLLAQVAEERPLICLVDDAQWLDGASTEVLAFVARRLTAESVAMVFAVRDGGDRSDRVRFEGMPVLPLVGLSADDGRALLATVVPGRLDPGVGDRVVAETGGNPLALWSCLAG